MNRVARCSALLLLGLALSACGFEPRGSAPAPSGALTPLAISGIDADTPLYLALQRRLGDGLSPDLGQAAAVLVISQRRSWRELLTVDARSKANEYELLESLVFVVRRGGEETAPQQLTASRIHYEPGSSVLARSREEAELRQTMREELADRLLRHLAALP
jgi:outer membrane lipopolysaccharide assembly protein LptE/RlpB